MITATRIIGIVVILLSFILASLPAQAQPPCPVCQEGAPAVALPRTGQMTCYDTAGIIIDCAGTGQDGDIQAGVARPDPRFTDNGDGTLTDNLTGLIWLQDANCIATQYPGFDNDGSAGDGAVLWQHALDFVAGINDGTYPNCGAGHTDWRLGNINELGTLTHFGVNQLWIWLMNQGFINVEPSYYWSSTTSAAASHWAWTLEILTANSLRTEADKRIGGYIYVWPVRGTTTPPAQVPKTGQVECYRGADPWGEIPCAGTGQDGEIQAGAPWPPRFTSYPDGTVKDNLTGLMWLKDANCFGGKTWQGALDTVSDFNVNPAAYHCADYTAIYDDWRLSNAIEFASLFNYQDFNLTWFNNPFHFSNVQAYWYWTSTTKASGSYAPYAWVGLVSSGGSVDFTEKSRGGTYLWPVRTVPVPPKVADIAVTKTDNPDPVAAGQSLTYTVTVINYGPDTATGVTVMDTLPANVTFISATPSQGVCSEYCGVVTCNLGELTANSPATVTVVVIPAAPGVIYNTVEASANENDTNPSNNTQTIPTVVIPSPFAPDISVSPASHDFGSIAVGSSSSKTFLISNEGTAGLTLGTLSIAGPQASEFSLGNDTCSDQVIPVNKDCTVDVVFSPVSEGPKGASLSIPSDDPDESPLLVSISGGDYTVHLHSRTFAPTPGISTAARDAIINSGLPRVHVLVQTKRVPTTGEVSDLVAQGLLWLVFIPNLTFYASLPADAQSVDSIAGHPVIRSVMLIAPEDRIGDNIKDGIDARLQYPDGTIALEVFSFFDVPMADARAAIASLVSEILAESERIRGFLVRASPGAITPLSQSDLVQFISEVAPPPQDDNDQVRIVTNVSNVQIVEDTTDGAGNMTGTQPGAPYALDGAGVAIGQWEQYHPDCSHPDFFGTLDSTGTITGTNPRVTYGDANVDCRDPSYSAAGDSTIGDHATHVAGIVLGNGSESAGAGGLALQWRGMAPNASIISYRRPSLDTDGDGVADAAPRVTHQAQYDNAIAAGIALSTNSWGFSHCHQVGGSCYETASAMYDAIITDPLNPDPLRGDALSILGSSGNCGPRGNADRCETVTGGGVWPNWGTVRVPNSAKNTIVVGNIFSDTRALVDSSSRGPVDDCRIKPDVVAPGNQEAAGLSIRSTVMTIFTDDAGSDGAQGAGCASNGNGGDIPLPIDDCAFPYDDLGGTSMSTPATTGAAALLVQQFRTRRGADPWPSTVKALLIHTAIDQCCTDSFQVGGAALDPDTPGPDYSFGYGLIDVQAGLDLLRNRRNGHVVQSDGFAGWGTCTTQPYDDCDYDGDGAEDDDLYRVTLPPGLGNYRVTLVYDDLPGAGGLLARGTRALVNDLDLFLVGPDGSVYRPWVLDPQNPAMAATTGIDNRNPVEVVDIANPASGEWTIVVRPTRLVPLFRFGAAGFGPAQRYTLIYESFNPDLMIRDHDFDNGGVPSAMGEGFLWLPTSPWTSPDIILEGEDAITPGIERAVQVTVSNIGEIKANNITVNLYWTNTGVDTDYPGYLVHPMGTCVIASLDPGQRSNPADCRILYTWNVGDLPFTEGRKYVCLLATVETAGDELTYPGNDTLPEGVNPRLFYVWDNNIAQKNSIEIILPPDGGGGDIGFEVRNPGLATAVIDLVQDTSKLPDGWEVQIFPSSSFSLPAGGKSWAKVTLVPPPGVLPWSRGEVSLYGWNQTTGELLGGFDVVAIVAPPDTIGPSLALTSHADAQHVTTSSITLTGMATDSGKGGNGIQQVTVNGLRANNDTATGTGTANWSVGVTLNPGANTITVIAYDDSSNHNTATQNLTIYYDVPDTTPPSLSITSHSNNQHVSTPSITLGGTASDSGKGDNGIQQVMVSGLRANNDTATGTGTANWSAGVTLNPGANTITVIAYDDSPTHNTTTQNLTIYYDAPTIIYVSKDDLCNGNYPCLPNIQNGIASAFVPSVIKITEETYNENIILNFGEVIVLQGGWDTNFTSNSSYTTIEGSITITNGTMMLENIILK
jgi:uncharacterized repeat protein (TIGR01451 family)